MGVQADTSGSSLSPATLGLSRIRARADAGMARTSPYEPHEAYLVVLRLSAYRVQDLWVDGRKINHDGFAAGTLSIYDLERRWEAQMRGAFDCLQFYVRQNTLDDIAAESGVRRRVHLRCAPTASRVDETVQHLASVILHAAGNSADASPMFLEHLSLAFHAHLVSFYAEQDNCLSVRPSEGGLTPSQLRRAYEFLHANLSDVVSVEGVAKECGLSRSHFGRAFKISTGVSPYQWVISQRLDLAKRLLRDREVGVSDVAIASGFSDQSHLTRMFSRREGMAPGHWRRLNI